MLGRRTVLIGGAVAGVSALLAACAPPTPTATTAPAKPTEAPAKSTGAPAKPTEASKPAAAATSPAPASPSSAGPSPAPSTSTTPAAAASPAGETVYVFNVGSKDVTLIDAASLKVRETRPLGAQVRWLSNEQSYWDGERIWTYDFPDNKVQAIAIDPRSIEVAKTIKDLGTGPSHSLVTLADKKKAAVNIAGDNVVAFLDLPSGQVEAKVKTGAFP